MIKEKSSHLEVQNNALQKKVNEYEADLIKMSKIKNELIEERDSIMRERLE